NTLAFIVSAARKNFSVFLTHCLSAPGGSLMAEYTKFDVRQGDVQIGTFTLESKRYRSRDTVRVASSEGLPAYLATAIAYITGSGCSEVQLRLWNPQHGLTIHPTEKWMPTGDRGRYAH